MPSDLQDTIKKGKGEEVEAIHSISDARQTMEAETDNSNNNSRGWRFWCVFAALCLISFICGIDATIVVTALPTITRELDGANDYIWIANSFVLATTAPQPLYAQLSNIFGRRNPMIIAISLFVLGSGIAAGASSPAMLIAGRTIQGLGSGGIFVLLDVIVCDLVPLRERAKYLGIMLSGAGIGTTVGPLLGGILAQADWRWIFYLNIPIAVIALASVVMFLKVNHKRSRSWQHALGRVDFIGNLVFIPSVISVLIGLISGSINPWSSWQVVLPLVFGFVGWAVFHFQRASRFCKEPSMPPQFFSNRTSAAGFLLTFISSILLQAVAYFMPVYFQAVLSKSPLGAGIDFFPYSAAMLPFAIGSGILLERTGRYRPIHAASFALMAVGLGLLSILDQNSSTGAWAGFQVIAAAGTGLTLSSILPAILAGLPEADAAAGTGVYSFIRSFGYIWGITIASVVFNAEFDRNAGVISDIARRMQLTNGAAYAFASGGNVSSLPQGTREEVLLVYTRALSTIWLVMVAFACLGFVVVFVEKHVELRKELETDYGLEERSEKANGPDRSA